MKVLYKSYYNANYNNNKNIYMPYTSLHYGEMPENEKEIYTDFSTVYEKAKQEYFGNNVLADSTLFKNKPYLEIRSDIFTDFIKIKPTNFDNLTIEFLYTEVTEKYNIKELAEELSAEDFVEWLKDKNIDTIIKI